MEYLVFTHSHKTLNFWELTLRDCPLVPHSCSTRTNKDASSRGRFMQGLGAQLVHGKNLQLMSARERMRPCEGNMLKITGKQNRVAPCNGVRFFARRLGPCKGAKKLQNSLFLVLRRNLADSPACHAGDSGGSTRREC